VTVNSEPITPEQQARNIRLFTRRKLIHWLSTGAAVVIAVVFLKIRNNGQPTPASYFIIFIVVMLAIALSSFFNWKCPSCNRYLGSYWNPHKCPKCGAKLQK
jgi:hypothetical protein